jgi:N-acetyl-gamma-glutamylphosphate reductase
MPAKVSVTGITGYIGGDAFHLIQQIHPDLEFLDLIRTEESFQAWLPET